MTFRLSRGEYWLLTNAVEYGLPLRVLTLPEWPQDDPHIATIDVVLNKRGHGLGVDELAETLHRILERGWIELSRDIRRQTPMHPDHEEIRRVLSEKGLFNEGVFYRLTPDGGRAWESFARPEWHLYVSRDDENGDDDMSIGEAVAPSRKSLERYMASLEKDISIEAGSRVYDELKPWQATYWKTLPAGFRCRYRYRRFEPTLPGALAPPCLPSTGWLLSRWCPWL